MAKYSKGAEKGVESAVKRMKKGTLRSGGSGKKVTSRKQAIAIGLSEAKKKGAKVPPAPKKKAAAKKSATKKAAAKRPAAKKAAPKKAATKKSAVKKKAAAKKAPVKKAAAKKSVAKNAPQKKAAVKKPVAKKAVSKPIRSKALPKKEDLPPKSELSEEMHEEGVQKEKETQSMMGSAHGAEILEKKEDPIMAFDMHMAQKATTKGHQNNKLRLSSTGQRPMRPSGKKPLWRK